jgi:nucleoside-diphosphate-sugar epimerase
MKAFVTGGGGFLGLALVKFLREGGHDVVSLQRGLYPELEKTGARCLRGDIGDIEGVRKAAAGCDTVFHVAAKAGVWGKYEDYYRVNVLGTRNVIDVCRDLNIPRLIFTSSPSAIFSGHDESGIDESVPYPPKHLAPYPRTKAIAERLVLSANGGGLATIALRPHLIWGPGDPHLVPRVIERAISGRLALVGSGENLVDPTYIDNAALAHLLSAERLAVDSPCAGKAYFISNGEPLPMRELINRILAAGGLPPVKRSVPPALAYLAGWFLETLYRLAGRSEEPVMTRFVARQLSTAHWYDIAAARRDFDYRPAVGIDEGMERLTQSLLGEGKDEVHRPR